MDESDLTARLERLSPAKRALLELRLRRDAQGALHGPIPRRSGAGVRAPLSFAQQRIWFLHQLEPDSAAYNEAAAIKLEGNLDVAALQSALNAIVERHEVLRSCIVVSGDGSPLQVAGDPRPVELSIFELSGAPVNDVQRTMAEIRNHPFRLDSDLMLRAALLRIGVTEHILVLVKHHIASDGWSSGILADELGKLYGVFSHGRPDSLLPLPIQYADYAVWQRHWLQGDFLERQLSFWREYLRELPTLELPTDRPRPAVQSYHGGRQSLDLPRSLTEQLNALSRQENATVFMTMLAAFQILLHRYTGQHDIAVGSPIAGRTRVETEGLIGFFVNTLVFRTDLSGNPTFKEILTRVRDRALKVYEHQDLPFEKIVEELNPGRDRSRSPLFQVSFAVQNGPRRSFTLPGLVATTIEIESATAKFDLTTALIERDGRQSLRIEYNTDLFNGDTINSLLRHFQILLETIVANPEQRLGEVSVLTAVEQRQLLIDWNRTAKDYPTDRRIHEVFEKQVERTPEAVAVAFENDQLTYRELNNRANQLAHYLQQFDVGSDVLVGICPARSVEMIVAVLGVLKAGGAYLPLDSSYPVARLSYMLKNSASAVLLTMREFKQALPEYCGHVICLDDDWEKISKESTANLGKEVSEEDLAYVIYTSGSTGRPKGVMIPHSAIHNHMTWMLEEFALNPADRVAQRTPFSFDASVWEILAPLMCGAQLVIAPQQACRDSEGLMDFIEKQKISVLQIVPVLLQMLLAQDLDRCATLRHVFCGGEALSSELYRQFRRQIAVPLTNLYGPTETTINATFCTAYGDCDRSWIPIGRPIANTKIYILDRYLMPVPQGAAGDIYIGGKGLARGYLNAPDLTSERFMDYPVSGQPAERLYKTGDGGRYLSDGNIEFLGRMDQQIKLRGFRIELGEIETAIAQTRGVQSAAVMVREAAPMDKRLVAYVVMREKARADAHELKAFLREKLPDYMVPSAFVFIDALPLTPSGKLDRDTLPALEFSPRDEYVAPRTPVEEMIAGIWAEVLRLDRVGVHDNFFDLGGHSLLATRVVSRIREIFRTDLALRKVFELPTVAGLSGHVKTVCGADAQDSPNASPPQDQTEEIIL